MALWAVFLAVFSAVVAAASAHAVSGGVGLSSEKAEGPSFGSRVLRVGMEGYDVKVLNGIVKSKPYTSGVRVTDVFESATDRAVRAFESKRGLGADGVVDKPTARQLLRSMRRAGATWYGPGFYGNRTACGRVLRRKTLGVAHRKLRCGTKVTFAYRGRTVVVPVIDRGPYTRGYAWDLTGAAAERLGLRYSAKVRFAIAR